MRLDRHIRRVYDTYMSNEIQVIHNNSSQYPQLLREIADPPPQLYTRGNIALLSNPHILAVVGSRKTNTYGKQCAQRLLPLIVQAGIPLVSGLAYGIDSLAHKTCIKHNTPTIAVLGSGINDNVIYPHSNTPLVYEILKHNGLIISEYEPNTCGQSSNFPKRNRIIAGLAKITLILQAGKRSGSLITARLALESNRDVLAVPGPITDPLSYGTNMLIQQGAQPVLQAQDILDIYDSENIFIKNLTNCSIHD